MFWSIRRACCYAASSPPPTFRIATAASRCWRPCSACFPSSRNCSPTAPIEGRFFTMPWPASAPILRSRSSRDPTGPRASSSSPGVGWSSGRSPGSTDAADWPGTGKTSTATRAPSSNSPPYASCSENSVILLKVSGRTLRYFARLPASLVGLEACASVHHWARSISALGHEVRLIAPSYVKRKRPGNPPYLTAPFSARVSA